MYLEFLLNNLARKKLHKNPIVEKIAEKLKPAFPLEGASTTMAIDRAKLIQKIFL